jgi:hypothetical protein
MPSARTSRCSRSSSPSGRCETPTPDSGAGPLLRAGDHAVRRAHPRAPSGGHRHQSGRSRHRPGQAGVGDSGSGSAAVPGAAFGSRPRRPGGRILALVLPPADPTRPLPPSRQAPGPAGSRLRRPEGTGPRDPPRDPARGGGPPEDARAARPARAVRRARGGDPGRGDRRPGDRPPGGPGPRDGRGGELRQRLGGPGVPVDVTKTQARWGSPPTSTSWAPTRRGWSTRWAPR